VLLSDYCLTYRSETAPPGGGLFYYFKNFYGFVMEDIRLNFNENPLGPSPMVVQAVVDAAEQLHRYGSESELERDLAVRHGLSVENVLLGNGSIELLDTVSRRMLGPGKNAITPQYSFAAYSLITQLTGAELRRADVGNNFSFIEGVIDAADRDTRVIWFSNPNNPTGIFLDISLIEQLLQEIDEKIIFVLDEAYIDFIDSSKVSSQELLVEYPNLIISRTFSKAHGIAGLRIGYLLGAEKIVSDLKLTRLPMSVSAVAIAAAQASLADGDYLDKTREFVSGQRNEIYQAFSRLGIEFLESKCNFVTFHLDDADQVKRALESKSIYIKEMSEFGMPDFLRVSIGSIQDNEHFIKSITEILGEKQDGTNR